MRAPILIGREQRSIILDAKEAISIKACFIVGPSESEDLHHGVTQTPMQLNEEHNVLSSRTDITCSQLRRSDIKAFVRVKSFAASVKEKRCFAGEVKMSKLAPRLCLTSCGQSPFWRLQPIPERLRTNNVQETQFHAV